MTARSRRSRRPGLGRVLLFFVVLAVVVGCAIVGGLVPRLARQKTLAAGAAEVTDRKPVVIVSTAHYAEGKGTIDLPGDLQSIVESPIFARADGYLKTRYVDIGEHVKAGQPMAEIETPELDQQISQAKATVAQMEATLKERQADIDLGKANLEMSRLTRDRWRNLLAKGVVSRQESDERQADYDVKAAQSAKAEAALATARETQRASEASLRRLEEMKSFARVTAPFDGIVTARNVDVGTLISAGTSKEMFRVAKIQPLRVFVNVPQTYVAEIHNGLEAELRVQERPGVFRARVTNVADALDANSRAMLVILETPNAGAVLYPGMYAQVRFTTARRQALRVPGDAIMLGKEGPRVATVGPDHVVHYRNVTLGEDLGSEVEITAGLAAGDLVISNPSDAVEDSARVDVRKR